MSFCWSAFTASPRLPSFSVAEAGTGVAVGAAVGTGVGTAVGATMGAAPLPPVRRT